MIIVSKHSHTNIIDGTSLLEGYQMSMMIWLKVPKSIKDKSAQNHDPSTSHVPRVFFA
jgi:hypothetical protein